MKLGLQKARRILGAVIAILAIVVLALPASAAPLNTPHVEAELHAARSAVAPGETFTVLLRQKMIPNWHVYWLNPGDSGEPTTLAWTKPDGVDIAPMRFPAPVIYALGPIVNYVHYGEIHYPMDVTVPADWPVGRPLTLSARAAWLVCEEICIPEEGDVSISIPVAAVGADDPIWAARAQEAIAALPTEAPEATLRADTSTGFALQIDAPTDSAFARTLARGLRNARYFPYSQTLIDHGAEQTVSFENERITVSAPLSLAFETAPPAFDGVLKGEVRSADGAWRPMAFAVGAPPPEREPAIPPSQPPQQQQAAAGGLLAAIALAFVGGLILNVMPCVFPVLSIKALSLAQAEPQTARTHGLLFLAGVLATFLVLAAGLIVLQAAGQSAGWGFQLQEPAVIAALALLFFVIGLNLVGAFEIGGSVQNFGGGLAEKRGGGGAFFTGALAVIAATPCTAPFMAGALGWAATAPPAQALAVFAGLGLGFAAPFTLLSFAPGLRTLLPKPGPWMERFRQILAFPMFGAAVWLVWVLTSQTGQNGAGAILSLMVAVAFAFWAWRQGGLVWRASGLAAAAFVALLTWPSLTAVPAPMTEIAAADDRWSVAAVEAARAEDRPVFVNFTADWCVSCKYNEAVALSRPAVQDAFAAQGVVYLKGDWTRRDADIAAELKTHGRAGVPLYLYYAPEAAAPIVLPQLLTEGLVLQTIGVADLK